MTVLTGSRPHYGALDGIRGAAAFTVMIGHSAYVYVDSMATSGGLGLILTQLIHLGHPAVVLFYVLSGFVLYVSFGQGGISLLPYLVRRIFRIYPALIAALMLAAALHFIQGPTYKIGLSEATNAHWVFSQDAVGFLRHLLLLGFTDADVQLDPVIWSLVIELRFSALFLALAALCRRSPVALVGLSLVAWAIGRALMWKLDVGVPYQIGGSALGSVALTLFYLPGFCFGIVAAHVLANKPPFSWGRLRDPARVAVCLSALLLAKLSKDDLVWSAAFTILIFTAANAGALRAVFTLKPILFLGKISYSLYLIHSPILLTLVFDLHGITPLWLSVVLAPCLSLVVAWLLYISVEKPGMALGKVFVRRSIRAAA